MCAVGIEYLKSMDRVESHAGTEIDKDVRLLRTLDEVEQLQQAWTQVQHHPNSDFDFYCSLMRRRAEAGWKPYVLVAERAGVPNAILVGRVETTEIKLRIGYAEIAKPQIRSLTFIYGGLLGNPGSEVCTKFAAAIRHSLQNGEADAAFFNHLRKDSLMYTALRAGTSALCLDRFPTMQPHRTLGFGENRKEFHDEMVAKLKRNKSWKKLLKDFGDGVAIRCFRDPSELQNAFSEVEQVARKTYQRALGVGFADNSEMRAQMELRAQKGLLSIFMLHVTGRPVAFWIGTAYEGIFHSDMMGFDPEFNKYSPGMYLLVRTVEGFADPTDAKIHAVDFGLGDAPYKEHLGNECWMDASLFQFAPRFRGVMLNIARTLLMTVDRAARFTLQRAKILQKVKSAWRRRMTAGQVENEAA